MNAPINKRSLAEEVAAKLQEQISLGHYKLNEKLPAEPELMKRFGVGRSSIREAVKLLANSGLLRVQQGLGTFVDKVTGDREPFDQRLKRANTADLDEVRQLLEMKIAEKAAVNRTDKDITAITHYLNERRLAAEHNLLEECIEADIQFHIAIAEAANNQILADLYRATTVHLKRSFIQSHTDTRVFMDTYHLHERLLKSIIAGDAKKAWSTVAKIIGHITQ